MPTAPEFSDSVLLEVIDTIVEDVITAKKSKPSLASVVLESITEMIQSYSMEPAYDDEVQVKQLDMIAEEETGESNTNIVNNANTNKSNTNVKKETSHVDRKRKSEDEEDSSYINQKPVSDNPANYSN